MNPGDFYLVNVRHTDGSNRQKQRLLLVVKDLGNGDILALESRGKPHNHLKLIGLVDFSCRGYLRKYVGQSYFYEENLRLFRIEDFPKEPRGGLTPQDFRLFFSSIDVLVQRFMTQHPQKDQSDKADS